MEKSDTDLKHDPKSPEMVEGCKNSAINQFDQIPDELVTCIFCKLSSTSNHSRDFFGALLVCKRFNMLGSQKEVLQCASQSLCTSWNKDFIQKCGDAGNMEACYTLGMLNFYVFKRREIGISLLQKAVDASHSKATFSLALIKFNGSGGKEESRDLQAGADLCEKAILLGHIGAYTELVLRVLFNKGFTATKETARLLTRIRPFDNCFNYDSTNKIVRSLSKWFSDHPPQNEMKLCSNSGCRRPETRKNEFGRLRNEFFCSSLCVYMTYKARRTCTG